MRVMSGVTAPVLGVRKPKRHRPASDHRWVTSLARGGTALVIACAVVGTTIAAAGHVLALAIDAHSDERTLVGRARASGGLSWFAEPNRTMIPQTVTATRTPAAGESRFVMAAAGSLGDDDLIFTGSIGNSGGSFNTPRIVPTIRFQNPAKPNGAFPLPRMRPQLAALTPPDFGVRPDETTQPAKTAIYDIAAQTVYLPNGEKLEAHSGFGDFMDDPKHVRLRMRGVTPPNTYKLTMREALFHGTEAIRLTPENREAMFGRNGILAHPYLLGPNGQSNGCVSIKDYPKFLAAFKRGEIERIVVVFRLDKPPSFFAKGGIMRAAKVL